LVINKNIPHLLFTGPAGVGKTTLSLIIAKSLFGEKLENFLESNSQFAHHSSEDEMEGG